MDKKEPNKNIHQEKIATSLKVTLNQKNDQPIPIEIRNKTKKFYKDRNFFTAIFSVLSLTISIVTLVKTISQQNDNKKKWETVNLARISVIDTKFNTFRTVSADDFLADSAYTLNGESNVAENDNPNVILIKSKIVAYDTIEKKVLQNIPPLRLDQLVKELKRRRWYNDPKKYIFEKIFQPIVTIQNVGQTSCTTALESTILYITTLITS